MNDSGAILVCAQADVRVSRVRRSCVIALAAAEHVKAARDSILQKGYRVGKNFNC